MTVQAIVLTKEDIQKELKYYRDLMEEHKKNYPGSEKLNKELGYDLRHGQYLYAQHVESHLTSMLCNFDYKASEIEVVKEPKIGK